MNSITASEARKNLFPLIKQVNDDCSPIHISSRGGSAVLVSEAEWNGLQETNYLLRNPHNAQRLMESLAQARAGQTVEHPLAELVELVEPGQSGQSGDGAGASNA
jgi:antitoxin YefM